MAESEGAKGEKRFEANKKLFSDMKSLKIKAENANLAAEKKFDAAYSKLFEAGETAAKAGKKLLEKYPEASEWLPVLLHRWETNKMHHHSAQGEFTHKKFAQASNTYAAVQELEALIKDFAKVLVEPNTVLDSSWRA